MASSGNGKNGRQYPRDEGGKFLEGNPGRPLNTPQGSAADSLIKSLSNRRDPQTKELLLEKWMRSLDECARGVGVLSGEKGAPAAQVAALKLIFDRLDPVPNMPAITINNIQATVLETLEAAREQMLESAGHGD